MLRAAVVVFVVGLSVIAGLGGLGTDFRGDVSGRQSSAGMLPTAGTFVGWRDDFNDTSRVVASSDVVFSGADVRLSISSNLSRVGLMLGRGAPGDFDSGELGGPSVLFDQGIYRMWYFGSPGGTWSVGYADSPDGRVWTKRGVVVSPSIPTDAASVAYSEVVKVGSQYRMYYSGSDGSTYRIHLATSADGLTWAKQGVVLDVGPPGSGEDGAVFEPSVIVRGGTYYMWYAGMLGSDGTMSIFLATSTDGVSWTRQGMVLPHGLPGSFDQFRAEDPTVRIVGTTYEMLYAAVNPSSGVRLVLAESTDGVSWQKKGYVLDLAPPDESTVLSTPFLHLEPNGTWDVYYQARGASLQIFLAVLPPPAKAGWLQSQDVGIPAGLDWAWFNQSAVVPANTWLNVSVRDSATGDFLAGLENTTAGSVDLRGVDAALYPGLVLEGWLAGNGSGTPVLDSWETSWTDRRQPMFAGLDLAVDLGTGGAVRLGWSAAADPSPPLVYRLYGARGGDPFDFSTSAYTTSATTFDVSGLTDGDAYRFVVRAVDAWGNEDTNTVERTVIPTTPVDSTPPNFGGLLTAIDARTGGTVRLSWATASDPDTAASNSDPSTPIGYWIFMNQSGSPIDFGSPKDSTTDLSIVVSGLTDGVGYDFVVRAVDDAGNGESNSIIRTATPTHPYDTTPPNFLGIDSAVDLGTGERIRVAWLSGSDPDTPESNVDPSLPLMYSVWVAENTEQLGVGPAVGTTASTSLEIGGLRPGHTYYVLVRATDSAGNTETNSRMMSIQVKEAVSVAPYAWIALILIIVIAVLAAGVVMWRRRRKGETPPTSPPPTR